MMGANEVVIAAAGSGKTTLLVREALKVVDARVLITTFTDSNEEEIRKKFHEIRGYVPSNVSIMTWFTVLIRHGVKPFQHPLFDFEVKGLLLTDKRSGFRYMMGKIPVYWAEANFQQFYFTSQQKVYSDKLSKLVIRCNEMSQGAVLDRLSRVFGHIFVDEFQDMAGYDLDIVRRLFAGPSRILLVGDPRQVLYQTHHEARHEQYTGGKIAEFLQAEIPRTVPYTVDTSTLALSHRNSAEICMISSKLYPHLGASHACACTNCRKGDGKNPGLFIVKPDKVHQFLNEYQPVQLRLNVSTIGVDNRFPAMNFGLSKGLGFDHVLIYPTGDMVKWIKNNNQVLADKTRAQLYVALTRARHSVGIVYDVKKSESVPGFSTYN